MARVLCIDDYPLYAEMVALMLEKKGGHTVKTEIVPLDLEEVRRYDPDVIVVNLVRKQEVLGSPLHDFASEVDGAKALHALVESPLTEQYALIITAIAVEERAIPKGIPYLAFIEIPQKLDMLNQAVIKVAASRKRDVAPE